jgi:hypothetical protein
MSEAEDMCELNVGDEIIFYRPGPGVEATHENRITRKIVAIDPESEYPLILDSSEDFLPIKLSRHHDVLKKDGELRYSIRIEDFELVKQGNPDIARAQTAANVQEAGEVLRSAQNDVVTAGNNFFRRYTPKKKIISLEFVFRQKFVVWYLNVIQLSEIMFGFVFWLMLCKRSSLARKQWLIL